MLALNGRLNVRGTSAAQHASGALDKPAYGEAPRSLATRRWNALSSQQRLVYTQRARELNEARPAAVAGAEGAGK